MKTCSVIIRNFWVLFTQLQDDLVAIFVMMVKTVAINGNFFIMQ